MMRKLLTNQKGFTAVELISVLTISTLLILISAVGLSVFFAKYRELNIWVELQKDALHCINTIKTGVAVGDQQNTQFYGVANARNLELIGAVFGGTTGTGVICTPPISDASQAIDKAQYYFDGRAVRVNYVYRGVQVASPLYLFPEEAKLDHYEITNFSVSKVNTGTEVNVIKVDLSARAKIRPDVYKSVNFSTMMTKSKSR